MLTFYLSYFRPKAYALNYPNPETARQSRKYVKNMKRLDVSLLYKIPCFTN